MIDIASCTLIGIIAKVLGHKGNLQIKLEGNDNTELLNESSSVFVFINGLMVPFMIDEIEVLSKTAIVKLTNVDTIEKATSLRDSAVYIEAGTPQDNSSVLTESDSELIGYSVYDKTHGLIGIIVGLNLIPKNPLFEIDNNGTAILVPANDDFIEAIDDENSMILINMPEGYFDVF